MLEPQRVVMPVLGSTAATEIAVRTEVSNITMLPAVRTQRRNPYTSDDLRERAKVEADRFNGQDVWLPLAVSLEHVRRERAYERWAFRSLSAYAEYELDITKGTASDLLNALHYVVILHPEYQSANSSTVELAPLPPYSSIAMLSRNTRWLPELLIDELDTLLFSGQLTRAALQERITRAKGRGKSRQAGRPHRRWPVQIVRDHGRDALLRALEALFEAVDLDDLWKTTTAVFEAWETVNVAERTKLLAQLCELIKRLTDIEELLEAEEK